jgi:DNA-binding winged helix-turn-helix (wHTH) protein
MINAGPPSTNERAISFGPFRFLAEQRLLLEGDNPVRLGNRAFDIPQHAPNYRLGLVS